MKFAFVELMENGLEILQHVWVRKQYWFLFTSMEIITFYLRVWKLLHSHYKYGNYNYCIVFTANCGDLLNPTNGQVLINGTTEGSIATYSCTNGYHVVGNTSRACQSDRQWSGNAPTCERKCMVFCNAYYTAFYAVLPLLLSLAVDCGPLSDPINGHVTTPNGTTLGFQANYNCNEGFFISGSPIRSCEANGVWSGPEPTCMSK